MRTFVILYTVFVSLVSLNFLCLCKNPNFLKTNKQMPGKHFLPMCLGKNSFLLVSSYVKPDQAIFLSNFF